MSQKRREQRRHKEAEAAGQIRWAAVLRAIVLGGGVALIVIGALIPSESAISDGTYAPIAAGWCLLLIVWAAAMWLDDRPAIRIGWTEAAGAALVGWHSLAAVVSLGHTNGRHALNAHWLILGYGLTVFLFRQSLRTSEQARALVAAMVWMATLLATLGLYQYGYGMPKLRREYEKDPTTVLQANGIPSEEGSPQRELFENRLRSVEPLATFALTNSLAGFLAPWLITALAIAFASTPWRKQWPPLLVYLVSAGLLAACLVLTKSRTAYLATAAGLVLIALYGRRRGWQLDWRIPAGLAGAAIVIGLAAVFFGGLDVQVLSEAPKSVLYRLEYWQATARVIADYPLFGCGPGNFQEAYAVHKLPQASETVADPHSLFLELWATAGTPAVILLVLLLLGFTVDLGILVHSGRSRGDDAEPAVAPAQWIVFGGAAIGLLIAAPVAAALGYSLEPLTPAFKSLPSAWVFGLLLMAAAWWFFDAWIKRGELTLTAVVVPQVVLLINLLAAGALVFPTVIATFLVLAPVAFRVAGNKGTLAEKGPGHARGATLPSHLILSPIMAALITFAAIVLTIACLYTEYYPVMDGRRALAEALYRLDRREYRDAEPQAVAAAKADSLSPDSWRLLAELRLGRWEATGSEKDWQAFVEVANTFNRLDPRHHLAWFTRGKWFLTAWRKSQRKEEIEEATVAFRKASERYPNRALLHAQLAWALHLAGQRDEARQEADRAWQLDQQMPHKEQKLNRQHVLDPQLVGRQVKELRDESAEQTVESLRTASADNKP
jgi:hypothetical protein